MNKLFQSQSVVCLIKRKKNEDMKLIPCKPVWQASKQMKEIFGSETNFKRFCYGKWSDKDFELIYCKKYIVETYLISILSSLYSFYSKLFISLSKFHVKTLR